MRLLVRVFSSIVSSSKLSYSLFQFSEVNWYHAVGTPVSTRIIASVLYTRENGVASCRDLCGSFVRP